MDPRLGQSARDRSCLKRGSNGYASCLAVAAVFFLLPALTRAKPPAHAGDSDWVLTWSDDFNGADGSVPDPAKWTVESGGRGWGNDELECYTSRSQNVHLGDGYLIISALKENFTGSDAQRCRFTSARLKTQGHFSQRYGRFEARIQVPPGKGLWPAFWMLGDNFSTVGWPGCGEIDVMENAGGTEPTIIHGSLHGPGYSGGTPVTAAYELPHGRFSDDFHVFSIEWSPKAVRFFVDGVLYATKTPADLPAGKQWVFDHPFFLLLNLAVGGKMPGSPDDLTPFPERMLVDYVRVYSRKQP